MDEFQTAEETAFDTHEIDTIIKESVEGVIGGNAYQHCRVNQWTTNVVEQCLSQLSKLSKPFKYIALDKIKRPPKHQYLSDMCYYAKEWSRFTDSQLVLLG